MYLEHFGLSGPPFQFTTSPDSVFLSATHREGLAALQWGLLHEPTGLTLMVGDSGIGKTTLLCSLLAQYYQQLRTAYVANPNFIFEEWFRSVMTQLGIRGGAQGKAAMLRAFGDFAMNCGQRIAIVIDEAQLLSDRCLEEIRLLSDLQVGGRKAAQIILAGQLELLTRLIEPRWHPLYDRIGARIVLSPLSTLESLQYLRHRVSLCHGNADRIFKRRALNYLARQGGGLPRQLNNLAHNALLAAYCANQRHVRLKLTRAVAAEYGAVPKPAGAFPPSELFKPALGLVLVGVLGFSVTAFLRPGLVWTGRSGSVQAQASRTMGPISPSSHGAPAAIPAAVKPVTGAAQKVNSLTALSIVNDKTSSRASARESNDGRRYVIVAAGDTLGSIARRYYGSDRVLPRLLRLNPQIVDVRRMFPGDIVYLPTNSTAASIQE